MLARQRLLRVGIGRIAQKRNRCSRKIEGTAVIATHDFHHIRPGQRRDRNGDGRCPDRRLTTGHDRDGAGQRFVRHKWLIALDVQDDRELGEFRTGGDFRHPVGTTRVIIAREDHRNAAGFAGREDFRMVGRDDDIVGNAERNHTLIDSDDERLAGEEAKRLAGKAGRAEARRDHREY